MTLTPDLYRLMCHLCLLIFLFPCVVNLSHFTLPALMLHTRAARSPSSSPSLSFMHPALSCSLQTKEVLDRLPCRCPFSPVPCTGTETTIVVTQFLERSLSCSSVYDIQDYNSVCGLLQRVFSQERTCGYHTCLMREGFSVECRGQRAEQTELQTQKCSTSLAGPDCTAAKIWQGGCGKPCT